MQQTFLAFNINNEVRFIPTKYAHEVHREQHFQFWEDVPNISYEFRIARQREYTPMIEDKDGFVSMQMHNFMHIFGGYLYIGAPNIVEDCQIFFAEAQTSKVIL